MRNRSLLISLSTLIAVCLLMACSTVPTKVKEDVDSLCLASYRLRYTDVDSASRLLQRATEMAENYQEGRARIGSQEAYLYYQKMDYDRALAMTDSVYSLTSNQITLLCADVMRMKVYQRIGDGGGFYQALSSATKRIHRAEEEAEHITGIDRANYVYAYSEYHIISSTYYYYQEQDSLSKAEMAAIDPEALHQVDTTQYLYYNYMMGSGGLVDGNYESVAIAEFNYLVECFIVSRRADIPYFEANALQALATRLKTAYDRQVISQKNPALYEWLLAQHLSWMPYEKEEGMHTKALMSEEEMVEEAYEDDELDEKMPLALALHALQGFLVYGDLFQTACVYRTLGELYAYNGDFDNAIEAFGSALDCVNRHHKEYYPKSAGDLVLYDADEHDTICTESRWIMDEKVKTVPEWMAGIRQQISLAFSALDHKDESDYNRNIYLDILESTSQNREMESRKQELEAENTLQLHLLITAAVLFLLMIMLAVFFFLRLRRHDVSTSRVSSKNARLLRDDKARVEELVDLLEETEEACELSKMRISQSKSNNAEKRAKVSLVQAVTPFLDRIINEVNRMKRKGTADKDQLQYVSELTDQIVDYNDILTDWIKMEHGQLRLQISTIQLSGIFHILERGHYAFDQQGIQLIVKPTELKVKADEALTLFMLNTLADNARKFTPQGGCVTIEAKEVDNYVELSVTDTGCGISESDIDTIVNSKVYDASKIGVTASASAENNETEATKTAKGRKGFGFGLMNCKGIIEKYKKTASIFDVCRFGIESKMGEGSRFFFRLPRVMMLIGVFMASVSMMAESKKDSVDNQKYEVVKYYYDIACKSNAAGFYADAILNCDTALYLMDPELYLFNYQNSTATPADLQAFQEGKDWDFTLLMQIRNQVAIASLALHEWDIYEYNNDICTNLHKRIHQDPNLPHYCEDLARSESASKQLTAVLVLLTIISLSLMYMLLRGKKKVANKMAMELQSKIDASNDVLSHYKFEENRLYVQNQVLDNCLSTIKHESMYYPSRIKQLAERMIDDDNSDALQQLSELTTYYKEMYTLLSGQAERQTMQTGLRREKLTMTEVLDEAESIFKKKSRKKKLETQLEVRVGVSEETGIHVDRILLQELFEQLFEYLLTQYPASSQHILSAETKDGFTCIALTCREMHYEADEAHNLFYPHKTNIPLLIVKQIIRDFDAMNNNPGLRLIAEEDKIWFTLPK